MELEARLAANPGGKRSHALCLHDGGPCSANWWMRVCRAPGLPGMGGATPSLVHLGFEGGSAAAPIGVHSSDYI